MIQALTLLAMALNLLIAASNPNVPEALKAQAVSIAGFAIQVANTVLKESSVASVSSTTNTSILGAVTPSLSPVPSTPSPSSPESQIIYVPVPMPIMPPPPPLPESPPVILMPRFIKDPYLFNLRTDIAQIKIEVSRESIGAQIKCYEGTTLISTEKRLVEIVIPIKKATTYRCVFQLMTADKDNNGIFLPDTREIIFTTPS